MIIIGNPEEMPMEPPATADFEGEYLTLEALAMACLFAPGMGGRILIFGNGGCAGHASHFSAELVGRWSAKHSRRRPLSALALNDPVVLTAIANDYGYDEVFRRQLEAHGRRGDLAIGMTTSGNSKNIMHALLWAGGNGLQTALITGPDVVPWETAVATCVHCACDLPGTGAIQESMLAVLHRLAAAIDAEAMGALGERD